MRVIGVVGWKNAGKTGLVERLVTELSARGHRVSTVKHAHHALDVDTPGTDSYRHRAAGAVEVLVSGAGRWALMHENREDPEPSLEALLSRLGAVDFVIVEGFKGAAIPKIEARRAESAGPPIAPGDPDVVAIASDAPVDGAGVPVIDLNDTAAIANVVEREARAP